MVVSIIIPCYNAEKYLDACLDAIKKQTFIEWEAICVNDGSTDNTLQILNKYSKEDNRFVVISQKNQGVSVARNNALKIAKGDFICFVDSDDIIRENYIYVMQSLITDETDLVICNFTRKISEIYNSISLGNYIEMSSYNCIDSIILDKHFNPQICCMLFKKQIIEDKHISFFTGCTRGEDWEFFMKYLVYTDIVVYTAEILYFYRRHTSSAMASLNVKSLTSIEAYKRVVDYYVSHKIPLESVKKYSVSRTIWKFMILSLLEHNMNIYKVLKSDYNVKSEMIKISSYPGMIEKVSSRLFLLSELLFRCSFYMLGYFYKLRN